MKGVLGDDELFDDVVRLLLLLLALFELTFPGGIVVDCRDVPVEVMPLKQRDSSAAARFVKLTSADIPGVFSLRHRARSPATKQAVLESF